jgi:hypothetical protein
MQSSLSLSRFLPSLWSSPTSQVEAGNIAAIALGAKTNLGTDIWALIDSRVQKWNVAAESFEELTLQEDIGVVLRHAIQETLHAPSAYLDLELLDLAVDRLVSRFTSSTFPTTKWFPQLRKATRPNVARRHWGTCRHELWFDTPEDL